MKQSTLDQKRKRANRNRRQADLAAIHILKKELCLSDYDYRALIGGVMDKRGLQGAASAANLDGRGRYDALQALRALQRAAAAPPPRYEGMGPPNLYPKQALFIGVLEEQLGWYEETTVEFIIRQIGILKTPPMLTPTEATKVITGMKAVLKTRAAK